MKGQNVVAVTINLIYLQFTAADMQLRDNILLTGKCLTNVSQY